MNAQVRYRCHSKSGGLHVPRLNLWSIDGQVESRGEAGPPRLKFWKTPKSWRLSGGAEGATQKVLGYRYRFLHFFAERGTTTSHAAAKMKTQWKDIPVVPTSQEFLDIVLSRTQRRLPTQVRHGTIATL